MGVLQLGIPEELALFLKQRFDLRLFLETGTFRGGTSAWASRHFERVITIENSRTLWEETRDRHKYLENVEFLHGRSPEVLASLRLRSPVLAWLDAHWCAGDSYGQDDECPLLSELDVLLGGNAGHVILIDDARLFLAPPPRPHRLESWPSIGQVVSVLEEQRRYWVAVVDDVIVAVPQHGRAAVAEHLQARASERGPSDGGLGSGLRAAWRQLLGRR